MPNTALETLFERLLERLDVHTPVCAVPDWRRVRVAWQFARDWAGRK
jgi:hypothetical protein